MMTELKLNCKNFNYKGVGAQMNTSMKIFIKRISLKNSEC